MGPGTSPVEGGEVGGEVKDESKNGALSVKLDIAKVNALLEFCQEAKSRTELQEFCKIRSQNYFRRNVLLPLIASGRLKRTIPDKPNSSKQKYIRG